MCSHSLTCAHDMCVCSHSYVPMIMIHVFVYVATHMCPSSCTQVMANPHGHPYPNDIQHTCAPARAHRSWRNVGATSSTHTHTHVCTYTYTYIHITHMHVHDHDTHVCACTCVYLNVRSKASCVGRGPSYTYSCKIQGGATTQY